MPQFFDRYIHLVKEEDLSSAFIASRKELEMLNIDQLKHIGGAVYAPGKWTIKDIFQHIIDNERIQSYRAMRIARFDSTPLPGYDENILANHAHASRRSIEDLLTELKAVRTTTELLYQSIEPAALVHNGICFNQQISALALGFVIIGHQTHHLNVIQEKYLILGS
ncbi:MAG: DinB family protein [Chitinophagaceae bacterium]|nr:DinB family protein [Chitinophagaceae bacterium]